MLTVQYTKALPDIKGNAVEQGFTSIDLTGNGAGQTPAEGAEVIGGVASMGHDCRRCLPRARGRARLVTPRYPLRGANRPHLRAGGLPAARPPPDCSARSRGALPQILYLHVASPTKRGSVRGRRSIERQHVYKNILLAYDGSPSAVYALQHAQAIAEAFHSRLTVLGVVPPVPAIAARSGVDISALARDAEDEAAQRLSDVAQTAPATRSITTVVRRGHPGAVISEEAAKGSYDLVVLGSRGHGRLASMVLRSVAANVHFHAAVPLLIVQLRHDDRAPNTPDD